MIPIPDLLDEARIRASNRRIHAKAVADVAEAYLAELARDGADPEVLGAVQDYAALARKVAATEEAAIPYQTVRDARRRLERALARHA